MFQLIMNSLGVDCKSDDSQTICIGFFYTETITLSANHEIMREAIAIVRSAVNKRWCNIFSKGKFTISAMGN